MIKFSPKVLFFTLFSVSSLFLSACSDISQPVDIKENVVYTSESGTNNTVSETETTLSEKTTAADSSNTDSEAVSAEPETSVIPKETEPPTTVSTAPVSTPPETTAAPLVTITQPITTTPYTQPTTTVPQTEQTTQTQPAPVTTAAPITAAPATEPPPTQTEPPLITTLPPETEQPPAVSEPAVVSSESGGKRGLTEEEKAFADKVFELTNNERAAHGLTPFQKMDTLDVIGEIRAWDLTIEYRPDHTRPDGSTFTSVFNANGIIYGMWGENIAAGFDTPEAVLEGWLNSPPHRAAILNPDYTYMGTGCYHIESDSQNYFYYWTQEFYSY